MPFHVPSIAESLATCPTFVRLFSCMPPLMSFKLPCLGECLFTPLTFMGFVCGVTFSLLGGYSLHWGGLYFSHHCHWNRLLGLLGLLGLLSLKKLCLTQQLVRPGNSRCMFGLFLSSCGAAKWLVTAGTLLRFFPRVLPLVAFHIACISEYFSTPVTSIRFLASM